MTIVLITLLILKKNWKPIDDYLQVLTQSFKQIPFFHQELIKNSIIDKVRNYKGSDTNEFLNAWKCRLGKTLAETPNVHRKVFSFYNCVPTAAQTGIELTYDVDATMEMQDTIWSYTHYAIEQLPDLPLQFVLDQIMGGGLMNVLNKATGGKLKRAVGKVTEPIDSVKNAGKVLKNLF